MRDYKAGDTIKLHGDRMNGDGHIFTLTIAEVYPEAVRHRVRQLCAVPIYQRPPVRA